MPQLAGIRGILDCYIAPGKAYLTRAVHRHLAADSSRRLLGGRGSLLTVEYFRHSKVRRGSIQLTGNIIEQSGAAAAVQSRRMLVSLPWLGELLLHPRGLVLSKQKVVPCCGLQPRRRSAFVPFLSSLSQVSLSSCLAVQLLSCWHF